ncbi:MAG: MOSC domain-containing protein [Chloroflexota bacterium]
MQIVSVNIGKAQKIDAKSGESGIFKKPQDTSVFVSELGLQDDVIVDTENHGGVDQAVYLYTVPDYVWWSAQLERDLLYGTFGENLTISELESAKLCVGDTLTIDDIILQVTAPRVPCVTLATRMNDPQFVKKFIAGRRYGAYCRVLQTGQVASGLSVTHTPFDGERVTINEFADVFYARKHEREQLERLLSTPVPQKVISRFETLLADL